jgi:integrase
VFNEAVRDLDAVRLPRWGRVLAVEGAVPWAVVGAAGEQVEPIQVVLVEFVLRDNRAGSVRSYAYGLLRWWRWLQAIDVAWDRATPAEVRDFVLWLRRARKGSGAPGPARRVRGSVNPITANWSMHDLRHTAGLRMSRDTSLTLKDVQIILGHAHLSTTADVYLVEEQSEIIRRVQRHLAGYPHRPEEPPSTAAGYAPRSAADHH